MIVGCLPLWKGAGFEMSHFDECANKDYNDEDTTNKEEGCSENNIRKLLQNMARVCWRLQYQHSFQVSS